MTNLDFLYELKEDIQWRKLREEEKKRREEEDYEEDLEAMGGNVEARLTKKDIDAIYNDDDFILQYTEEDVKKFEKYIRNIGEEDENAY